MTTITDEIIDGEKVKVRTTVLKEGETHWTPGSTKREFFGPGTVVIYTDRYGGAAQYHIERTTAKVRYKADIHANTTY